MRKNNTLIDISNFSKFGNNKGVVLLVDNAKIDRCIIQQLRNYCNAKEKEITEKEKALKH